MFEMLITCKLLVAISQSSKSLCPNYIPVSTKLYKFMFYTQPLWRRAFRDVAQAVDWVKANFVRSKCTELKCKSAYKRRFSKLHCFTIYIAFNWCFFPDNCKEYGRNGRAELCAKPMRIWGGGSSTASRGRSVFIKFKEWCQRGMDEAKFGKWNIITVVQIVEPRVHASIGKVDVTWCAVDWLTGPDL